MGGVTLDVFSSLCVCCGLSSQVSGVLAFFASYSLPLLVIWPWHLLGQKQTVSQILPSHQRPMVTEPPGPSVPSGLFSTVLVFRQPME